MKIVCILQLSFLPIFSASFISCNKSELNLQWKPLTANYSVGNSLKGTLLVTRETWLMERWYGNFHLECDYNAKIVNSSFLNIFIPQQVETLVKFSLQKLNAANPTSCHLQYCFTRMSGDNCTNQQCNFTIPPQLSVLSNSYSKRSNNSEMESTIPQWINQSYNEPVHFQWIPINDESGNLIITYYNEKKDKNYDYEVACNRMFVANSTFSSFVDGAFNYRVLNVSLLVVKSGRPYRVPYYCILTVCIDRVQHDCQDTESFNIDIPDMDIVHQKVASRSYVLYYHWQKPNSAVKLQPTGDQSNCDNIEFYWLMNKNKAQGQFVVRYKIPSTYQVLLYAQFSVSCSAQVRPTAKIPNVLIQQHFGTITMIFTLEYFHNNTYCSMEFCYFRNCGFQAAYCGLIFLFEDWQQQEEQMDEHSMVLRESEPCRMNTWLWVAHSSEEGEVHFVLEDDILDAAKHDGKISLSCTSLDVISLNPQSMQHILANADVASFVIHTTKHSSGSTECVLDICVQTNHADYNIIYKCYITIPLDQAAFKSISQSNVLETCPQSIWRLNHTENGGILSIRIRQEDRGEIGIDCSGITVYGPNKMNNTNDATFHLIKNLHDKSPPYCNVRICVRQDQFIGCKKSLDCVMRIPHKSARASRVAQSYEEPSDELLKRCEQENLEPDSTIPSCSDKMWDIFYTTGYAEGKVSLQINLQGNDQIDEFLKVSIYCSGLDLKGSTVYKMVIPKTEKERIVEFNISLPKSNNEELQTYQCTLKTQRRPISHDQQANDTICPSTQSCSISVKTVLGRILPKCNAIKGRKSVHHLNVKYNQAKVEIVVSASPNNVYTVDPYCNKNNPFGHNTTEELLSNMFPSTTSGKGQVTIAISFHPECDNKTIAPHFVKKRLEDCHMDLYWYCQEGEELIKSITNLQFSDESMYCEPQSIAKRLIQSIQKSFGVYSEPVAILLAILVGVASLYVLLIPATIITAYYHNKKSIDNDVTKLDKWNNTDNCFRKETRLTH